MSVRNTGQTFFCHGGKMETFCSEEIGKLAQALLKVQRQLQPALKDADNPFTKSRYATLNSVTHAESGQWQASLAVVPLPRADPQGVGISMTYIRRYALSAMLGIVTEEDTDGEFPKNRQIGPYARKGPQMPLRSKKMLQA